jgi:hypothetical protein
VQSSVSSADICKGDDGLKKVQKTRIQKKHLVILSFLLAFAIALTVSLVLTSALSGTGENKPTVSEPIEVIPGEGRQNGMPLAYPSITRKMQITFAEITNKDGKYGIYRYGDDNYHTLFYVKDGETVPYYPEIVNEDPNFDYTDLFAIETGDGIGRYSLIDYLCSALQMPYFDQRVAFERDPA